MTKVYLSALMEEGTKEDIFRMLVQKDAEVERLQKEWLSLYGVERMRFEAIQKMTAEIERLRARVSQLEALDQA